MIRFVFLAFLAFGMAACGSGSEDRSSVGGQVEQNAHDAMDSAHDAASKMSDQAEDAAQKTGAAMQNAADQAGDTMDSAMDKAKDTARHGDKRRTPPTTRATK